MKRITANRARAMIESGLAKEINHINIEGTNPVNSIGECSKIVERFTKDALYTPADYYRIGSYLNIKRTNCWTHQISVFYYQDSRGEERKWPQ